MSGFKDNRCIICCFQGQADLSSCPRCRAGTKYYARNITFCDTQCGGAKKKLTKKPTKKPTKKAIKKTTNKSTNNKKKYHEISVKAKSPVVYGKVEPYRYVQPLGPMGEFYKSLVLANTW